MKSTTRLKNQEYKINVHGEILTIEEEEEDEHEDEDDDGEKEEEKEEGKTLYYDLEKKNQRKSMSTAKFPVGGGAKGEVT